MTRKNTGPAIILASGSPYRRTLLSRLNLEFTVAAPDIEETPQFGEKASDLALRLAESKARAAAKSYSNALVIGSDQVAILDHQLIGKPGCYEKALELLQQASGSSMTFYTAICLLNAGNGKAQLDVVSCTVAFRTLSQEMIDGYLRLEQPYDCAGAFKSEGLGIALLDKIITDDPTSLVGLPLIRLSKMLAQEGIDVFVGN